MLENVKSGDIVHPNCDSKTRRCAFFTIALCGVADVDSARHADCSHSVYFPPSTSIVIWGLDSGLQSRVYSSCVSSQAMQIGEAAKQASSTVDAIRFYERRGLLPRAPRTIGRFRLYSGDDVARLQFIRKMQTLGFSLREIKQLLDLRSSKVEACGSVRKLLKAKVSAIRTKMHELQTLEKELAADLRRCSRELEHRKQHNPCACPMLEMENQKR